MSTYLAAHDTLVPHHAAWHEVNGPGGTRGPGSGAAFLSMHHSMVVDLERFIRASGRDADLLPLTEWRPTETIPAALGTFDRYSNSPNLPMPSWLTTTGGNEKSPLFGYTRLSELKSLDELGRALASGPPNNLGYHGAGHASVGGLMWSAHAPEDPVFWLWHKHIDGIVDSWLATDNGRAWLATAEGRSWQAGAGTDHDHMNMSMDMNAATDPVAARTQELIRLRDSDPAAYKAIMDRSSFTQPDAAVRTPANALPLDVIKTQRFPALGVDVQTLQQHLDVPWSMTFAPDGRIFFTERSAGRLRVIKDGVLQPDPVLTLPVGTGEGGLLGMALDPSFSTNSYVYLYYTKPGNTENRVVRVALEGPDAGKEVPLVTGIAAAGNHNGGRIAIGPDGKLYITTGDAARGMNAQNLKSLNGKILRVNLDGTAPADNPFVNNPDADPRVYSYGHRNPQGLSWNTKGELFESELGASSHDEINLIKPGLNYGWPLAEGDAHRPKYEPPLVHAGTEPSWAPSGGTFLTSDTIPAWKNRYFMAMLGFGPGAARGIQMFDFDENHVMRSRQTLFQNVFGRIRSITQGPDGYLYVTTSNKDGRGTIGTDDDQILRIVPLDAK